MISCRTSLRRLGASGAPVAVVGVWSGDPGRSDLEGITLTVADTSGDQNDPSTDRTDRSALWVRGSSLSDELVSDELVQLLGAEGPGFFAYQAKELERSLLGFGVDMTGLRLDVGVAAYLLDPSSGQYSLESVADTYLGVTIDSGSAAVGPARARHGAKRPGRR